MSVTIKIYGASDDLVEVEGPPGLGDEFGGDDDVRYVVLSTGDVFTVKYGEHGVWEVEHDVNTGDLHSVEIDRAERHEDADPNTDTARVSGDIAWVDCWREWPPAADQVRERIEDGDLLAELDAEELRAVYEAGRKRFESLEAALTASRETA